MGHLDKTTRFISHLNIDLPDSKLAHDFLNMLPTGVIIISGAIIKWANHSVKNMLGYEKDEISEIEVSTFINEKKTVYQVKDNGIGFGEKYMAKIFNIFQQLHNNREFEGTEVGHAIVKRVISKHNGNVWAKSELSNGATFYFSLPKII